MHHNRELRNTASDCHAFAQRQVPNDARFPGDPQRFAFPRNHEEDREVRILEKIPERVDPLVAGPVWDRQILLVKHFHKADGIALRRNIRVTIRVAEAMTMKGDFSIMARDTGSM